MSLFDRIKAKFRSGAVQPCPLAKGTVMVTVHRRDGGAAVANANVTVSGPSPGAGATDAQGSLILYERSPGKYDATVTLPAQLARQHVRLLPGALSGSVGAGGVVILNAEAVGTGHLAVEVYDDTPVLVTDDIVIRANGAQPLGQPSKVGKHLFSDVAAGSYTVSTTVPAAKYDTATVSQAGVEVVQGATTNVRLNVTKKKPKIISVAFLDGGNSIEVASASQYVNLARAPASVDGVIVANIDRSGHTPRIKVRFDQPGAHHFQIKLLPQGANAVYTGTETARNARFLYQKDEKSYTTDGNGSKILPLADFFVAAAGKDKYKLEGRDDNGITVRSGDLEVHRLVYYVEIKMQGLTTVATSLATVEAEYAKHNIKLVKLPAVEMVAMPNISNSDSDDFMTKARAAYLASQAVGKQPYAVAIAYTGHLAVRNPSQLVEKSAVQVGPGKPAVQIPILAVGLTTGVLEEPTYLWQGLVPGESWFVSAKFLKDGGTAADEVDLLPAKCSAVAESPGTPDRAHTVRIDVTGLAAATGTIKLTVNVVDRMRGGLSFTGSNLVCVCTKAWWANEDTASQNQVIIHELGHTTGMAANGSGKLPDKTASWYDDSKGHRGDHCFFGNAAGQPRYDANTDGALSKCVMYGATNGKSAFCAHCEPALRKVDLSDGWSAF